MPLEIRNVGTSNLPDAARLCLAGKSLSDRPPAFTRDVEIESTRCKLSLLRGLTLKGAKLLAAYRSGMLVGYLEAHPVEEALVPIGGKGFHVIACLRVPEEGERAEVEAALVDELAKQVPQSRGIAVLARDKVWTAMGFEDVAREASEIEAYDNVLWWRKLRDGGDLPELIQPDRKIAKIEGKVRVDLFTSDRCPWDRYVFGLIRQVCAGLGKSVVVYETDCTRRREILRSGVTAACAVNGRYQAWFRPHRLADEHDIRRTIEHEM